jgi:hypothetical protein
MPEPMLRTSSMPSGQRNCPVIISIPIIFRSAFGRSCNHSRTGSRPVSARKETAGNNRGTWMTVSFLIHPTSKKYALYYADCSASSDKSGSCLAKNWISALAQWGSLRTSAAVIIAFGEPDPRYPPLMTYFENWCPQKDTVSA